MAKKVFSNIKHGRDISKTMSEFDMDDETKLTIEKIEIEPTKENLINAVEIIDEDRKLSPKDKDELKQILRDNFVNMFNFDNCPDDYESLKEEAKFLAGMTQYSFLLMAQRLKKIKENKLYENDGYLDFKAFVENEITVGRRTAYNYIDLIEFFGVQTFAHENNIEFSKLLPVISILKSNDVNDKVKDDLKKEMIKKIKIESAREIASEVKELKIKYGLVSEKTTKTNIRSIFMQFIKKLPDELTAKEITELKSIGSDIGLIVDQNKTRGGVLKEWKEVFFRNV